MTAEASNPMSEPPPRSEVDPAAPSSTFDDNDPADQLARELRALGAETPVQHQVKQVAPWAISLGIHLVLVFIGFLIPWTTSLLREDDAPPPVAIVADFQHLNPVELVLENTESAEHDLEQLEDRTIEIEAASPAELLNDFATDPASLIGPAVGDPMRGFAPGTSNLDVRFGGLRGSNARNIVYVVDASGSMLAYLPIVIDELTRSIDQLTDTQRFGVVFFQRNEAILVPGRGAPDRESEVSRGTRLELMPATQENKLHVFKWIDLDSGNIRAVGKSNPLEAIRLALDRSQPTPDVIFILSTDITGVGEFEVEREDLLRMITGMNRGPRNGLKSIIKTIQFIHDDPLRTLQLIAEQNGGADGYKFLSRDELGIDR